MFLARKGACWSLAASLLVCACAQGPRPSVDARVQGLLARTPLIDGHNDLLIHYLSADMKALGTVDQYDIRTRTTGQVDVPRLRAGRVGAAIFTVGINDQSNRKAAVMASTGLLRELANRSTVDLEVVTDAAGVMRAFRDGRVGALMGLEGGDQLGGSIDVLRAAYQSGVRSLTLMWERTNDIGDASSDAPRHQGLSAFGDTLIREMNRLGMLVDLSHASDRAAFDALAVTQAPVILSHSSARALVPAPRNVPDTLLRLVAKNGGVVMITFVPYFTTTAYWNWFQRGELHWSQLMVKHKGDRPAVVREFAAWDSANVPPTVRVQDVADHVEHVRHVAGIDHVGLGADFDGMDAFRTTGLEDVSTFPSLFRELATRGWSDQDLRKLAGENFLRVLRQVEATARTATRRP
jgi:membrane dipeptidase